MITRKKCANCPNYFTTFSDLADELTLCPICEEAGKPKRKRTPKKNLESGVVKDCLNYLVLDSRIAYVERRNTGAVSFGEKGFIRFGAKGAADIFCVLKDGRHVEIECKRADGKGRLSTAQQEFSKHCVTNGIPYVVITSVAELEKYLRSLLTDND